MDFHKITIPQSSKLSSLHQFMFLHEGTTYHLEVHRYSAQEFVGYIESGTDPSRKFPPVTSDSLEACVQSLLDSVVHIMGQQHRSTG